MRQKLDQSPSFKIVYCFFPLALLLMVLFIYTVSSIDYVWHVKHWLLFIFFSVPQASSHLASSSKTVNSKSKRENIKYAAWAAQQLAHKYKVGSSTDLSILVLSWLSIPNNRTQLSWFARCIMCLGLFCVFFPEDITSWLLDWNCCLSEFKVFVKFYICDPLPQTPP